MEIWLHERMCAFAHARTHTHAHNYCISLDTCMQISLKGGCIYSATAAKALRMKGNRNYCLRLTFFFVLRLFSYRHDFKNNNLVLFWKKRQSYINASNLVSWQPCFFLDRWFLLVKSQGNEKMGVLNLNFMDVLQVLLILKLMLETCQKSWKSGVFTIVL